MSICSKQLPAYYYYHYSYLHNMAGNLLSYNARLKIFLLKQTQHPVIVKKNLITALPKLKINSLLKKLISIYH